MIFAEILHEEKYEDFYYVLKAYVQQFFPNTKSGLHGDGWIEISEKNEVVSIDTFSSMKFQVKTSTPESKLVQKVIEIVSQKYKVKIYDTPEIEPHEDFDFDV